MASTGFELVTSRWWCDAVTIWAMTSRTTLLRLLMCCFKCFRDEWIKELNDRYEINHILNCGYEIKWIYDPRSCERNFGTGIASLFISKNGTRKSVWFRKEERVRREDRGTGCFPVTYYFRYPLPYLFLLSLRILFAFSPIFLAPKTSRTRAFLWF